MRYFAEEAIQLVDMDKEPGASGIRLLIMDVSRLPSEYIFELGRLLTPAELAKASRFKDQARRNVYLASWGMLRKIAADILGEPAAGLAIAEDTYGKPFFRQYKGILPFNLASSGSVAAIAIDLGGREIGVDVELINTTFSYWNFAGYYFSIRECDRIFNHRDYFRYITQKEALLKATGVRVVGDATKIDLSTPTSRVPVTDERLLPYKHRAFTLYTLEDELAALTLAVPTTDAGARIPGDLRLTEVYFQ